MGRKAAGVANVIDLANNRPPLLLAASIVLFQLADASMLRSIGVGLAHSGRALSSLWMSGLIIAPQIVAEYDNSALADYIADAR